MKPRSQHLEEPEEKGEEKSWLRPLKYILAIAIILIIIIMAIPYYAVKLDPEPKNIPTIDEIILPNLEAENRTDVTAKNDFYRLVNGNDQEIKIMADKIVSYGCDSSRICQAKAIYYFVRNNLIYISDPPYEYVKGPKETLLTKGGDCDDHAVLLANLMEAIGIETEFVFTENHVYNRIYLPESLNKYKIKGTGWVNLDATCKICDFGEITIH